jgi:hypothetical protein
MGIFSTKIKLTNVNLFVKFLKIVKDLLTIVEQIYMKHIYAYQDKYDVCVKIIEAFIMKIEQ